MDWWDLHPGIPIYCDNSSIIYNQSTKWTTRVVQFDALGLRHSTPQGKRWEDESGPVVDGEHTHLTCAQRGGQCEQCSQAKLQMTPDGETTEMRSLGDGSSDEDGSHSVLPTRGRKYRRFARRGKRGLLRGVQNVKAARLLVLQPDSPDFFQLQ